MKATKMEDSNNTIELDVTISENNTITVSRSRPNSPTTKSSNGQPKSKSSTPSHRSRKEKLVVRSFSTETNEPGDDMEPHILTREEFLREKRAKSLGSGPSTRESSPVDDREDVPASSPRKKDELLHPDGVDLDKDYDSHPPLEGETKQKNTASSSSPTQPKLKLNKKKKHKSSEGKEKRSKYKLKHVYKKTAKFADSLSQTSSVKKSSPSRSSATFVKNSTLSFSPDKEHLHRALYSSAAAGFVTKSKRPQFKSRSTPPQPPPPAERKFVKYNLLQDRLPKEWFKDSVNVTKTKSPSFTIPRRPSMASSKKNQPQQKIPTNKSSTIPAVDSTNEKNDIRIHCMSNEEVEAIGKSSRADALALSQGMEKFTDLVKNIGPNQLKIEGATIPQICAEAMAHMVKVASEFPTVSTSAPNSCSELSDSLEENKEQATENEENVKSSHPFVHHVKSLIRNQGITKELKVLMESNQELQEADGANSFHPMFAVGASFMRNSRPALPRIRVEELEILKELLTPDDHFELAEDEMEMVKLYIELMRKELKAFKEDQKKTKRMNLQLNNDHEQEEPSAGGLKIVDAYAIPVKFSSEEERCQIKSALPGLILSQEEVVEKILNDNSSGTQCKDSLKELKTRRLRNGKEVELKKIRLENDKLKSRSTIDKDVSTGKPVPNSKSSSATTASFTVPPTQIDTKNNAFITMEPVMTLRDGKELPYDGKGFDIFRNGDKPFFKVEVKPELFERDLKPWGLDINGVAGICSDEYSRKVDANMKRLRDGGKEYEYEYERASKLITAGERDDVSKLYSDYTPFSEKERFLLATTNIGSATAISSALNNSTFSLLPCGSLPSTSTAASKTLSLAPSPNPQYRRKLFSLPSEAATSCRTQASLPPSSYISNGYSTGYNNNAGSGSGGILSSPQQKQLRARYSRQQHSTLCPPFENNHCSFTTHYCPSPRAPGSRFCISHVDEGATLQFERCKYFKDSRECGRFIPKTDLNSLHVFCELHATIVAHARQKKLKTERQKANSKPRSAILLNQLNNNLDRTKGAIMELNEDGVFSVRKDLIQDDNDTLNDSSGSESDDDEGNAEKLAEAVGDEDTDVDDLDVDVEGVFPGSGFTGLRGSSISSPSDEYNYDCLRHAGYVTVDETAKIYKQKLRQKKQVLERFMELEKIKFRHGWRQFCRDTGWLKRQRINFTTDPKLISTSTLQSTKYGNVSEEKLDEFITDEMKARDATKSVLSHRLNRGPRSLLRHQVLRKRQQIFAQSEIKRDKFECKEEAKICSRPRPTPILICCFGSGGNEGQMRCSSVCLPLSRFCPLHINEDKIQKLLRPCRFQYGPDVDDVCSTPTLTHLEEFGCPIHAIPMLPKEVPPTLKENRGPKVEEEIGKVLQEVSDEEMAGGEEEGEVVQDLAYDDDELEQEMEDLIGDEMVDMDHLRQVVRSIYGNGLYATDSEESDDTDEEEDEEQQPEEEVGPEG